MRFPRIAAGAVLAALLVMPAQAVAEPASRIAGGGPTTQPWPAQTSVRHLVSGTTTNCGGTLLSARWVLTAGHCVTLGNGDVVPPGAFTLRTGSTSRESGGTLSSVDAVNRHPNFSDTPADPPDYDLTLLHLVGTAPEAPMRLIASGAADAPLWAPGTTATVIGWGRTSATGPLSPTVLLEGRLPIVGDATCAGPNPPNWESQFRVATMFCAGGGTVDTCPGDSGGPIMVPRRNEFTLVGVTSWGHRNCGTQSTPGVYARLADPALNAWVRATVPTVSFTSSPATPVAGSPTVFAATTSAGGNPSVLWDVNNDGAFDASGPTVSVTYPTAGSTVVAVKADVTDAAGGTDSTALVRETFTIDPAPPPPPPPPPAPPPPPPVEQPVSRALTNGIGVTAQMKLVTLRVKGLRARFTCEQACTLKGVLTIGPIGAKRVGLGGNGKPVTIATGSARRSSAGAGTLTLKLTQRARAALRNRDRVTLSLRTELRAGGAPLVAKSPISVRR